MIVTVTCNPAFDVTYFVDRLSAGGVHRVNEVRQRAGGKGVNVARVLHQLGESVVATGFSNSEFGSSVEETGLPAAFVLALAHVRRTVVVHSGDVTTSFWEPGSSLTDPVGGATALESRVSSLLVGATALVVSGSLAPGLDPALPYRLAKLAHVAGIPALLDLDDAPLRAAADGGGAVLLPNREELGRLVGTSGVIDVVRAAGQVASRSAAPVVATLGSLGMVAVSGEGTWHASLPHPVEGNPTGAGDAAAAAIARGLGRRDSWPDILSEAVALSAAAVATPVAGEVDLERYRCWRPKVTVRPVDSLMI